MGIRTRSPEGQLHPKKYSWPITTEQVVSAGKLSGSDLVDSRRNRDLHHPAKFSIVRKERRGSVSATGVTPYRNSVE
jgi:hypothetical protein